MFSRIATFVIIAILCVVHADEGDCTNEIFGTVATGKTAYAGCTGNYDGYQSALCTEGVYGTADVTYCTARAVTIFSYGVEAVEYMVGETISTLTLFTEGGMTEFSVSPDLPAGLSLNDETGAITGTVITATPEAGYIISSGEYSVTLKITVSTIICRQLDSFTQVADGSISTSATACPVGYEGSATRLCTGGFFGALNIAGCVVKSPSNLAYMGVTSVKRGYAIILTPTYLNNVVSFSVSPALPAGIAMTSKGTISGVPTGAVGTTSHTVTANGATGTNSATVTVTITVQNANCDGLENDSGVVQTIDNGQNLILSCPEGYSNDSYRKCENGVFQDLISLGCMAKKPTAFSYGANSFVILIKTQFTTGIPTIQGIADFYSTSSTLPEGLTINPSTGEISGMIDSIISIPSIKVNAKATQSSMDSNAASVNLSFTVIESSCDATSDYKLSQAGSSSSYKCPDGYEGTMKRKCVRENDKGVWSLPDVHCQKVQEYTFLIICIVIFVVCLIILIIGFAVKSGRSRSKNVKSLKNSPSKSAPKVVKAPTSAAPKPKSTKVAI